VKDDATTGTNLGPAGTHYDGYQAAFDAAVAGMPYTTTGATRYRFGVVDSPVEDNSGGMSWYFEVWRDDTTTYNAMNPAHIIRECLTNPYMRMNYPESMIDDDSFTAAADTFYDEGMGLCFFWANQTTVKEFIQTVLDHCGAVYYADPFTGKFILKAIRGDYDVDEFEEFDESSIISVESFERSGAGEIVNEISVQYFDVATAKDAVLTVQDLASVNSQGSIVAETRQYPGLSHPALAARVAQRDLTANTAALARIKVRFTREAATIRPGDVIKLSWAKLGITSLVCRVMDVSYGGLNNGEIRAELAEDVFGLPNSSYQEDQPTGWDPASDNPAPVADQYVMEGTYWDVSQDLGPGDFAALSDTSGFVYTLAEAANAAQYSHGIYSRIAPADFALSIDEQPFAFKTQLAAGVIRSDTEIEVDDTGDGSFGLAIAVGDRLILPGGTTEEQMEVTDLSNLATGIIGVNRGILDTTPQIIASGTDVWLLEYTEEDFGRDGVEQFDGDTVNYKLTSTSSTGESPPELASVQTLTYDSRIFRPYPPGKIRIDGEAFPAGDVSSGFTVDWSHRDRTQQTTEFVDQDAASIGPEAGTTYNLYFYDDDTETLKHTETNVDDDTFTMPDVSGTFDARLEIEAERDGVVSWERQIREFSYDGVPLTSVFASDPMTYSGWAGVTGPAAFYNSSEDLTYVTWMFNGTAGAGQKGVHISAYDHSTDTWSERYTVGNYTLLDDDHGHAAICQDADGYFYCFYGCHHTNVEWSISNSANDHSKWSKQAGISGSYTYPSPVLVGSTIYLFLRDSTVSDNYKLVMRSGTPSAGAVTFGSATTLVDFGSDSRMYRGIAQKVGTDIHFIATRANNADTERKGVYYFIYKTSTGAVTNFDGSTSVASGSLPVTLTQSNASFRIFNHGSGKGDRPSLAFDTGGTPHVLFIDNENTATYYLKHMYVSGGAWSTPETLATITDRFPSAGYTDTVTCIAGASGTVQAWYTNASGQQLRQVRSSGGTWGAAATLIDTTGYNFRSTAVLNAHADLRVLTSETIDTAVDADAEYLNLYGFGDSGLLSAAIPMAAVDSLWADVVNLLPFEHKNGNTRPIDSGPGSFVAALNGNANVSSNKLELDGNGDYLTWSHVAIHSVSSGDFTIEAFITIDVTGRIQMIATKRSAATAAEYAFYITAANKIAALAWGAASAVVINITGTTSLSSATEYHCAISRSGTTWRIFLDGALEANATESASPSGNSVGLTVGRDPSVTPTRDLDGRMRGFRFTSAARYTAAFTAPTYPLPER
jgi:hypothetical protein